jgi:hypothetical protein
VHLAGGQPANVTPDRKPGARNPICNLAGLYRVAESGTQGPVVVGNRRADALGAGVGGGSPQSTK